MRVECKFKVALEAAKDGKTLSQLAQEYQLHPGQIREWKRQSLVRRTSLCQSNQAQKQVEQVTREAELYEQSGRLESLP